MFKKISLILLILLSSCDQPTSNRRGADGYKFGSVQYERSSVQVNVVTYSNQNDFDYKLKQMKLPETTVAFSTIRPPYDVCTIHMIDPRFRYQPEYVGHEFLHCVYGQWHTDNNSFN